MKNTHLSSEKQGCINCHLGQWKKIESDVINYPRSMSRAKGYYYLVLIGRSRTVKAWGAIQGTFTTAVVSKSALNLLYYRKSPPGTIYYGKKSIRELFTTDSEFTPQVKTCSKGRNLLQGVYPVVNFVYG